MSIVEPFVAGEPQKHIGGFADSLAEAASVFSGKTFSRKEVFIFYFYFLYGLAQIVFKKSLKNFKIFKFRLDFTETYVTFVFI